MRGKIKSRLRVRLQGVMVPFFPSARLFLFLGGLTIAEPPPHIGHQVKLPLSGNPVAPATDPCPPPGHTGPKDAPWVV